jgi:hypothetical protein
MFTLGIGGGLLYLNSRRRLEAGTLEGAKVTVKDVRVLTMNEAAGEKYQRRDFRMNATGVSRRMSAIGSTRITAKTFIMPF